MLGVVNSPPETTPQRRALVLRTLIRLGCFLALAIAVGAVAGVVWWAVVDLPAYRVNSDGGAATTERGLTEDMGWTSLGLIPSPIAGGDGNQEYLLAGRKP